MADYELAEVLEKLNELDHEVSQLRFEMNRLQSIVAKLVHTLQNQNINIIDNNTTPSPAPTP